MKNYNYNGNNAGTFSQGNAGNEMMIARCSNGNGVSKSDVIEYLRRVITIQAKREECRRICDRLNEEYRKSQRVPGEPVMQRPHIRIKRAVLFGLAVEFVLLCLRQTELNRTLQGLVPWVTILLFVGIPFFLAKRDYDREARYRAFRIEQAARDKVVLQTEYSMIKGLEKQCDRSLAALYSPGILKPRYQTLPACTFILESLQNGLTHSLERMPGSADPGAYGMFEELLRHNAVVDRLDTISGKIDELTEIVVRNQRMLSEQLNQINRNIECAVSELAQIKKISAYTAVNSQIIANNTAAIRENTASTAFYTQCVALNSSKTFSEKLRTRTGLDF